MRPQKNQNPDRSLTSWAGISALTLAVALGLAACGNDTNNTPPPAPAASSNPGIAGWNSVTERVTFCDFPGFCPGGAGFTVNSDGTYDNGRGNPNSTGSLTPAEMNTLRAAADAVAGENLSGQNPACTQPSPMPGMSAYTDTMMQGTSVELTIADVRSGQSCYLGDPGMAAALHNQLAHLITVYDKQPQPSPSPSASASPMVSPMPIAVGIPHPAVAPAPRH